MANLFEAAEAAGTFTHFLEHAQVAGLVPQLKSDGPYTIFAPTDAAVGNLPAETLAAVSASPDLITRIATYHVLEGKYTPTDLEGLSTITTLQGEDIEVFNADGQTKVDSAVLATPAIEADNGIIYPIDVVLVPEAAALALQS